MRHARVLGHCRSVRGLSARTGTRLWICAWIDADLLATGRVEVAEGPADLSPGTLVVLRLLPEAPDGVDAIVAGSVGDLGATGPGTDDPRRRVWIGDRANVRETGQPQNRH